MANLVATSDEDARKLILEFDQAKVGETAMLHGKETWGGMSWVDRLGALKEHIEQNESPPPIVKPPPTPPAVVKPPPTPPVKVATPVTQSLPVAAPPPPPPSQNPPPEVVRVPTPVSPVQPSPIAEVSPSIPPSVTPPVVPVTRERADSRVSTISKISRKSSVRSAKSVPKPSPPTSAQPTPISAVLTPLAPPPVAVGLSNLSATPSVASLAQSAGRAPSAVPSNTRSRTQSVVSHHSIVSATPQQQNIRPPTPQTPSDAQPIATLPVGATPPSFAKPPIIKTKTAKVVRTQKSSSEACESCRAKDARIDELEAALEEWQQQAGHWRQQAEGGGELMAELEASRQREEEANQRVASLEEQLAGIEDPSILMSQVWTLEKALALRNSEITRLNDILTEFTARIETLDAKLAQALKKLVAETRAEFSAEEKELFGMTVDEAMTEFTKKRKRTRRASTASRGSKVNALEAELNQIRLENDELKEKFRSRPFQGITGQGSAGYKDNNQVRERDALIQSLQSQLQKAQEAILSGVEAGAEMRRESELKLRETRGVLKNLVRHQSAQFASFNSKQPTAAAVDCGPVDSPIWEEGAAPKPIDELTLMPSVPQTVNFRSFPSAVSGIPQSILPIHPSRCRNISPPRLPPGRLM